MELGRIAAEERAVARQLAKMRQLPALQQGAEVVERPRAAVKKERTPVGSVELLPSQTSSRARHGLMLGIGVVALFVYAMVGGFFIYRIMTQP